MLVTLQEIVNKVNKAERRLFLYHCPRRQFGNTERDLRRQGAAERLELAFTSRSVEESQYCL